MSKDKTKESRNEKIAKMMAGSSIYYRRETKKPTGYIDECLEVCGHDLDECHAHLVKLIKELKVPGEADTPVKKAPPDSSVR